MCIAIMLRKFFYWLGQSNYAPWSSLRSSPESAAVYTATSLPTDHNADAVDQRAASLPVDLILEIFLRLDYAAVACCAGVCKPWRRAIIANASILGPHLDRSLGPSLLLGVFHHDTTAACLRRTPGPFQSALPSNGAGGNETPAKSLIPGAAAAAFPTLLSSRDGFILLAERSGSRLCLCNPVTGYRTIVPAAAAAKHCRYILLAGSSSSPTSDDDPAPAPAVRILAVHRREEVFIMFADEETLAYQLFSTSGERAWAWGPVIRCSGDHLEQRRLGVRMAPLSTAVGRDVVYWLAGPQFEITCVVALDVRTGSTWTIELQMRYHQSVLGMSDDGRLFLVRSLRGPRVQVWVLSGDAQWTLQRTIPIDMDNPQGSRSLTGDNPRSSAACLTAFCPRSRCVAAMWLDQELLIDIDGSSGSSSRIRRLGKQKACPCRHYCDHCPYEMESSSTYISKMKQF